MRPLMARCNRTRSTAQNTRDSTTQRTPNHPIRISVHIGTDGPTRHRTHCSLLRVLSPPAASPDARLLPFRPPALIGVTVNYSTLYSPLENRVADKAFVPAEGEPFPHKHQPMHVAPTNRRRYLLESCSLRDMTEPFWCLPCLCPCSTASGMAYGKPKKVGMPKRCKKAVPVDEAVPVTGGVTAVAAEPPTSPPRKAQENLEPVAPKSPGVLRQMQLTRDAMRRACSARPIASAAC